jgi:putative ubiquitin-RnfH superfamily antitoxin RatB of RatAB toxin-antitoxin module
MSELEILQSELEILLWNSKFGIYSKEYFKKEYKRILEEMERLDVSRD